MTTVNGDSLLACHNVSRFFAGRKTRPFAKPKPIQAVSNVTLSVRRNETLAIVGESGCGKSTLARVMIRLLKPSAGHVVYDGQDIDTLPEAAMRALRRDLQFVFQDPYSSLHPRMTIGAIVEEPLRVHAIGPPAERKRRVAELLDRVGLRPEVASRYPHEFSGGQRQRIGIARALASGPKLIIGDEPVSALDVSVQAQVVNLLDDLKQDFGLTLVIIAHDLAVVRHMSDRVAVMYLGEIVELAPADPLFEQPRHPYTQALMAAIPIPAPQARKAAIAVEGDLPSPTSPPSGCRFHPRCRYAIERCSLEKPALTVIDNERSVACHRWRDIDTVTVFDTATARTDAADQRFALYRRWRERQQ